MRLRPIRPAVLVLALAATSCAGLDRADQGRLQPQTVAGPCDVKKFFILNLTAVHTDMTVRNTGEACAMTIFNPDLQLVTTAALVTAPPAHGTARADRLLNGYQAGAAYTPQPGYAGPDRFTITLEPQDRAIDVRVTVVPAG